jgi:two-component system phosphate regulon sensor histidine kinase PhoR
MSAFGFPTHSDMSMPTSQVFWRLSLSLTIFALAWGIVCGSPPAENEFAALPMWRLRCSAMVVVTLSCALLVSRALVRPLTEPLWAINKFTRDLAEVDPSLELMTGPREDEESSSGNLRSVGRQVAARLVNLRTEQHRLEESHDRLAVVLEAMVEGVISVDRDQRILWANKAALRLLDVKVGRIVDHPLESVRLPRLQDLVKESIAGAETDSLEFAVPRTQATVVAVVSRLPGTPCPGAVIVLHDVTDLRRLENLRREFVSNVSHELKTPLAAISAYTETLLDGALDDPTINRGFVSRIEEQSERLNTLILDLLELARVETDDHAFELEPVNVGAALQESINEHLNIAESKNLTLTGVTQSESVWTLADPGGLRTIIDNLMDNAINYTPAGGAVTVRWTLSEEWVCIDIVDTGVGIAKEHQGRIFERFFRVDRARSREVGGTGLGLSIVKHLCHVFGGEIKVQSRLGQGSTFSVRLPAATPVAN